MPLQTFHDVTLQPRERPVPASRGERQWFFIVFTASAVGVLGLLWPFRYVLLVAAMIVVVSRPIFERICGWTRGHRGIAAGLTTLFLFACVVAPVVLVAQTAIAEVRPLLERVQAAVSDPTFLGRVSDELTTARAFAPWAAEVIPDGADLLTTIRGALDNRIEQGLAFASNAVPSIMAAVFGAGIHVVIFVFAVITLFLEGPALTRFVIELSPMDDGYDQRLLTVFRQFAHNVIVASFGTACAQGAVGALGYKIAGIDHVILLGLLTTLGGFLPIVGTTIVWVPVALVVYLDRGAGWAAFVVVWSLLATTSVDNLVRPYLVRGGSGIHPLLIFIGLFGGLVWMGLPGLIMGPVLIAMFLALHRIYVEDFLGSAGPDGSIASPRG
jgi:predicted PurR-regulated permease PerM